MSVAADLGSDLVSPWGLARLEDGSALVSERDTGRIVQVAADGSVSDHEIGAFGAEMRRVAEEYAARIRWDE